MSTDFGRLTPYSGKSLLRGLLLRQTAQTHRARSVRSIRLQSHPLTRLLRDSAAPTVQFLIIFLIGLTFATLSPKTISDPQPELPISTPSARTISP
jgi:hypothetical protein